MTEQTNDPGALASQPSPQDLSHKVNEEAGVAEENIGNPKGQTVAKSINKTSSVVRGVALSTGGFVELGLGDGGYLKVHVSSRPDDGYSSSQAWRWIRHDSDRSLTGLAVEIRDAIDLLLKDAALDQPTGGSND